MQLHVINSNSKGNCYLLIGETETLIIECGVNFKQVKQALNFDLSKVVGCLVTHEHMDHCKGVFDFAKAGIDIWASRPTHEAIQDNYRKGYRLAMPVEYYPAAKYLFGKFNLGQFTILPFDVKHDAAEPVGFVIKHPECGVVLFATDTIYLPNTFKGLNNIIIEANYCEDIINEKLVAGGNKFVRDRVLNSHMSIQTCIEALQANDLSRVNNIVLIHLSDSNSNAKQFKEKTEAATGKKVHIASSGLNIDFNKTPF
jgi:phosphoribosyl 1,2-cyclic phosphodiesterase